MCDSALCQVLRASWLKRVWWFFLLFHCSTGPQTGVHSDDSLSSKAPPPPTPLCVAHFQTRQWERVVGILYISLLLGWVGGQQLWWSNTISAASISLSSALSPVWVWCNLRGCRAAAFLLNAVTIFFGLQATTHSFTSLLTVFFNWNLRN